MATTATAAQEAVERAKSIAARLSGETNASTATTTSTTTTTAKRKRWGDAGDAATTFTAATATDEVLPGLANAAKKLKDSEASVQKRIWVSTSKKPAAHFVAYLSERLVALKENTSTNQEELSHIVMQLKGRGSSKDPPVPGMPEEPLHVFLQGSATVVTNLEPQIELLIQEAEEALLLEDDAADESNQTALLTDGSDHPTASGTSSSTAYKPASVAQLIGQALVPNAVKNGGGHYGPNGAESVELLEEQIAVPNGVVGFVIGRGGETISSLQAKSGAKIQIQKEHEVPPGQGHRVITLIAQTKEAIDSCRTMIEAMVQDRIRSNTNSNGNSGGGHHHHGGGGGGGGSNSSPQEQKVQEALAMGHQLVQIQVPDADVGLIIGKMGSTIQSIQDRSGGASIQIPPHGDADNPTMRTVSITHPTLEGANMARQIIEDILKSKPSFSNQHQQQQQQSQQGPQITVQVTIPDKDVGLCIGRQGCVIREMQHKTNTRIQIPSQPTPGLSYRIATVIGTQEGCTLVENLIQRIIVEQSSACVMSGTPFHANQANGGYGQQGHMQQQQQPYYQQQAQQSQYFAGDGQQQLQQGQEYSPEWAAYYAAQAASQQQQQQMTSAAAAATATATSAAATAAAGQPAADAYYEQFFRYAYYYGEEAARAYYQAWSPPVGTPNPYGQNPSGISAPPTNNGGGVDPNAAAAAAPAAAAPVAQQPAVINARDTSVRKVSNLPAWMTKSS